MNELKNKDIKYNEITEVEILSSQEPILSINENDDIPVIPENISLQTQTSEESGSPF
jgi:hypothetical protein